MSNAAHEAWVLIRTLRQLQPLGVAGRVSVDGDCSGRLVWMHRDSCSVHQIDAESPTMLALGLAVDVVDVESAEPRIQTSMSAAVEEDLHALPRPLGGMPASLASLARWLAEVMDKRGADASPQVAARLATELRQTLATLATGRADGAPEDAVSQLLARLSTPERGGHGA